MAKEGIMRSLDLWRENGIQESTQSFSICSEVDPVAFNVFLTEEVRNSFREEIAAQFRTLLRQHERLHATNSLMDAGYRVAQNMDNPGPSGTHGSFHQDISIPDACLFGTIRNSQIFVEIVEEPLSDGIKFRYAREGRLSSRIIGVNSTKALKTFPTIKIHGYQGAAYVVVSLVSLGPPYYPHPHKLAGKSCKNGVCVKQIDNPEMICSFNNLRIQCVKRKDVKTSLDEREALQVDPFKTGFSHSNEPKRINYNAIRLCFQVFLPDSNGQFCRPLDPVLSTPIGNKTVCDLAIMKLSHCSAPVTGNQEIILLCGQVKKDDIEIIFYEENKDKKIIWIAKGEFSPDDVHCKVAISFKTPVYINPNIQKQVKCYVFLRRPSDGIKGKPREFILYPSKRGYANQLHESNVPVNQLNSPPSAPALRNISNYDYASSYYTKEPVSPADAECIVIQQNIHQNIDVNPIDEQMESLSGNLSEMALDSTTEAAAITSVGLIDGKIVDVQNSYQVNTRKEDVCAEVSVESDYQREFNSNESVANLSGMTIDSFTETVGLISVGLIDEQMHYKPVSFQ